MATRLLNVRISPEDEQIASQLRARGVSISELMRKALRAEAAAVAQQPVDAKNLIAEILSLHPTPPGTMRRRVDPTDRDAVRKHIQTRLRQR